MIKCPSCGADLSMLGSLVFWQELPERASAHFELGEHGVVISLDALIDGDEPTVSVQCSECGDYIQLEGEFELEEVTIDLELETIER